VNLALWSKIQMALDGSSLIRPDSMKPSESR
jgi:hypothetical protein